MISLGTAKNTSPDKDVEKDYFYRQFVF